MYEAIKVEADGGDWNLLFFFLPSHKFTLDK
jgi:hypothetical protein